MTVRQDHSSTLSYDGQSRNSFVFDGTDFVSVSACLQRQMAMFQVQRTILCKSTAMTHLHMLEQWNATVVLSITRRTGEFRSLVKEGDRSNSEALDLFCRAD